MVTSVGFSVLKTRGEEWLSNTTPFCFDRPQMRPCFLNTDSNMTCHSERESNAASDCCKLAHCATSVGNRTPHGSPLPPHSRQHAARLQTQCPRPSPPSARTSPLWGSTYCPRFTVFLIVDLLVVDSHSCCCSHSCRVFPLCSVPMTSASPCTIPQTRPTKLALMKRQRTTDELCVTVSHVGPRYGIKVCYLRTDRSEIELRHLRSHLVLTRVSGVHTEIRLHTTSAIHSCSFQLNLTPLQLLSLLSFAFLCASLWRFIFWLRPPLLSSRPFLCRR